MQQHIHRHVPINDHMDVTRVQYNNCSRTEMWLEECCDVLIHFYYHHYYYCYFSRVHPLHDSHLRYQERQLK